MVTTKKEIIINELGQKVRVHNWEDVVRRTNLRRMLTAESDLSGQTLIVKHTWGLGDILYSTPAIHRLKQKFPTCKLIYISVYPDILENNPDVDRAIHYMDHDAISDLEDEMEGEWFWLDYDTPLKGGLDYKLHLRQKPALNEFMVKLLRKPIDDLTQDERDFVDQASKSVITRYKQVALDMYCGHAFCDEPETEKTVFYYPYEYELEMARRFLKPPRAAGKKIVTLMPHSSSLYKDYPYWHEVIRLSSQDLFWMILDSRMRPEESWIGPNIANLSGCFKTRQAAALIIEADMHCSSDTGLLYTRAARGGKCVVTYGPHEPQPFLHYFPSAHGLRIERLKTTVGMEGMCSTACFIDTESCHVKGEPAPCLQELHPQVVADKIKELLK